MDSEFVWIVLAAILPFSIAATFAGWLKLKRDLYLVFYVLPVMAYFIAFISINGIDYQSVLMQNWYWGILGAGLAGALVIRNVFSQSSSPRSRGFAYLSDLLWPGLIYGLTDALILSVLPIMAVYLALGEAEWSGTLAGKIGLGALALMASLVVTALYHLGYPEYRNKTVLWTMFGNGILSLAYILTMSPLAAILPHIAMHMTAMTHGPKTTGQVPPHYQKNPSV